MVGAPVSQRQAGALDPGAGEAEWAAILPSIRRSISGPPNARHQRRRGAPSADAVDAHTGSLPGTLRIEGTLGSHETPSKGKSLMRFCNVTHKYYCGID